MRYDKFVVYVSSRNNYDLFKGEVLRNLYKSNVPFINIDDYSCEEELSKGKSICAEHDIPFIPNQKRGLLWAAQTAIDYTKNNYPQAKYIIHFQHDNYPMFDDFYDKFQEYIESGFLDQFGSVGFNILDKDGRNTKKSYKARLNGANVIGMCGVANLEASPAIYYCANHISMPWEKWQHPFAVDSTFWCCVAINIEKFEKYVEPTDRYHLHLWGAEMSYRFNVNNIYNICIPDLYVVNYMGVKSKYGICSNSAKGARGGDEYHFGHYDHFEVFKDRWGFEYTNTRKTFERVKDRYKDTLMYDFYNHNIESGPLKQWKLDKKKP